MYSVAVALETLNLVLTVSIAVTSFVDELLTLPTLNADSVVLTLPVTGLVGAGLSTRLRVLSIPAIKD